MNVELVEQVIQDVKAVLGCPTRNQQQTLDGIRDFALQPLGPDASGRAGQLAYHVGLYVTGNDPSLLECGIKLMSIINLRSPHTTKREKRAAEVIYPTAWDCLNDEDL